MTKNKEKDLKNEKNDSAASPESTQVTAEETAQDVHQEQDAKSEAKEDNQLSEEDKLRLQIDELKGKLAKEKDDYIRLMAEFDNFRRRTAQEKLDLVSVASMDTIKGLLPVLDDCERALAVLGESADSEAAKEGTNLIYTKLLSYLQSKGLAMIEAAGKEFDTDLHEAVAKFPVQEEDKKGKVFDVVQTGYTLNGKVIRFAKVVVGI